MILDELLEFADATALDTSGTDTDLIGDVIDLGTGSRDLGAGQPMWFVVQVTTAITSAGAATVQFSLASDAAAAIATDGTQTIHYLSFAIPKATLVAGYELVVPLPGPNPPYERYLGFQTVTAVAALTAGAVNAFLTFDAHHWKSYADATN